MGVFVKRNRFPLEECPYYMLTHVESTGEQYINTKYKPKWNTRVVMELSNFDDSASQSFLFGTRNEGNGTAADNYTLGVRDKKFRVDYMGSSTFFTQTVSTGKIVIDYNRNICTINNETITSAARTSGESVNPLLLFAINNMGVSAAWAKMWFLSCKIYEASVLIRDYIPVKIKNSGAVGLWDKVEKKFYPDVSGTGFVAGEVVA